MSAVLWVVGSIVVAVGLLLAVDWFTAGRSKRRLVRAREQSTDNAGVGYAATERNIRGTGQGGTGGGTGI